MRHEIDKEQTEELDFGGEAAIERDPELAAAEHEPFRALLTARYGERERLYEVGVGG